VKIKTIMRAKLSALRDGRIADDSEFTSILLDTNITAETSVAPEDEDLEDEDEDEDEDEQVEGENVETEHDLEARVDHLMMNLMQQSEEHQGTTMSILLIQFHRLKMLPLDDRNCIWTLNLERIFMVMMMSDLWDTTRRWTR
jgi:hypothetical protein